MYDKIADQMKALKSNYQRSRYARLTTEQREEYIHVMDNRKNRKTSVTLMEATS